MHQFQLTQPHNLASSTTPIAFLPGWGFTAEILQLANQYKSQAIPWIIPQELIDPYTIVHDLHSFLTHNSIQRIDIIGWSLGAYAAMNFARQFPEKINRVILIAMRNKWPQEEIDAIQSELARNPEKCLRSFYRKCFLGDKKTYRVFTELFEPPLLNNTDVKKLSRGLDFLAENQPQQMTQKETFLLHGGRDIIAPITEMSDVHHARRTILSQSGHAAFLSDEFWQLVNPRSKKSIRKRFSKAAATYEEHATIQKSAATHLQDFTDKKGSINSILEIGCGTGTHTRYLSSQWPAADIVALDFSSDMVREAKKNQPPNSQVNFLCADGEQFLYDPYTSFDLITSNACFQWFEDIETAIHNMAHALSPFGKISCSMFGPQTLRELSQGLTEVLNQPFSIPAASFPSIETVREALKINFSDFQLEEKILFRHYASFRDLLMQLRKTGTGSLQSPPLFTPSQIRRLDDWFHDNYDGYRLSYQILLFKASI